MHSCTEGKAFLIQSQFSRLKKISLNQCIFPGFCQETCQISLNQASLSLGADADADAGSLRQATELRNGGHWAALFRGAVAARTNLILSADDRVAGPLIIWRHLAQTHLTGRDTTGSEHVCFCEGRERENKEKREQENSFRYPAFLISQVEFLQQPFCFLFLLVRCFGVRRRGLLRTQHSA